MTIENDGLALRSRDIEGLVLPTLEFTADEARLLCARVYGFIGNSVPNGSEGKAKQTRWKIQVASRVKEARGECPWQDGDSYAITVGFSFHMPCHGNQKKLDVENFVKPAIDALAAGLFCQVNPRDIQRWGCNDSNFTTLLIHRLPDAVSREAEGAAIAVSSRGR